MPPGLGKARQTLDREVGADYGRAASPMRRLATYSFSSLCFRFHPHTTSPAMKVNPAPPGIM